MAEIFGLKNKMVNIKKISKFYRNDGGQSIVEFALLLPIMLLITFFVLSIALGNYYKTTLNNMIREVARVVSVSENEAPEKTEEKVNKVVQAYATFGPLVLEVDDADKFKLEWDEEIVSITYKAITVSATYSGLDLPFIGPFAVSSKLVYPKLYVSPDIWED